MKKLNTLITIARYWPAIGGSEMHCRQLAQSISQLQDVEVLYFNGNGSVSNEQACCTSDEQSFLDDGTQPSKSIVEPRVIKHNRLDTGVWTHQAGVNALSRNILHWAIGKETSLIDSGHRPKRNNLFKRLMVHLIILIVACTHVWRQGKNSNVFHNIYNGLTGLTLATYIVARLKGGAFYWTPLITDGHKPGTAWSHWLFVWLYRRADRLIVLTQFEKKWLIARGIKGSKIHVVPMGPIVEKTANAQAFRRDLKFDRSPLVLFMSRLVRDKGFDIVLEASELVLKRFPTCQFVLIGPDSADEESSASDLFKQYQHPNIRWIDAVTQQQKTDALAACDCLCVPTKQEGLGGVFIEAWSQKKPVIAGDIDVLRTVVSDQIDGLLVSHQADAVAAALIELLEQPQKARKMGMQGYQKVKFFYQWDEIAQSLHGLYHQEFLTQR
jgi:glycosyltransferase involved in cell wall biosynthesis